MTTTTHMSLTDARAVRDGIIDYIYYNNTNEDNYEFRADNGTEISLRKDWDGYILNIDDVTRTYGVKLLFDALDDINIDEEFVLGTYAWVMSINASCNGDEVCARMRLTDTERKGGRA